MRYPFYLQLFPEIEGGFQVGNTVQFVKYHSVVDTVYRDFPAIKFIEQFPAFADDLGQTNRFDTQIFFGKSKVDVGFLLFGIDFQKDDIFRIFVACNHVSQFLDIGFFRERSLQ